MVVSGEKLEQEQEARGAEGGGKGPGDWFGAQASQRSLQRPPAGRRRHKSPECMHAVEFFLLALGWGFAGVPSFECLRPIHAGVCMAGVTKQGAGSAARGCRVQRAGAAWLLHVSCQPVTRACTCSPGNSHGLVLASACRVVRGDCGACGECFVHPGQVCFVL